MGLEGGYELIRLMPGQVVDKDPDGLLEAERVILAEFMKPKTIKMTFIFRKDTK